MAEDDVFKDIGFRTAREFLEELVKLSESSAAPPGYRPTWVFRGHGDAGWDLLPTAWRPDGGAACLAPLRDRIRPKVDQAFDKKYPKKNDPGDTKERDKYCHHFAGILAELEATRQFCQTADELGQSVPNAENLLTVDQAIRHIFNVESGPHDVHFPELSKTELFQGNDSPFIFAQHHGIPTRYLDWTRDPLVAAFFAMEFASEAQQSIELTKKRRSSHLCVWAVKVESSPTGFVRWVTVPRARHQYLHAQSGLCSVIPFSFADGFHSSEGKWPTLDKVLLGNYSPAPPGPPVEVSKINLQVGETSELLKLLSVRGITRAKLMPTLDNVAAVTKRSWEWLKNPSGA